MRLHSPAVLFLLAAAAFSQTGPTATPQQAPRTAPQVQQVLPSYEGQTVSSIELAGQPGIDPNRFATYMAQRAGQPFSQQKVQQTLRELEQSGRFHAVELEIRPDPAGVRILYVLQPAMYFGIYEFPGADGKFAYSRLLQVADYPPRGAYTPVDVDDARKALLTFFQREGYFLAQVTPELQVDRQHGVVNVRYTTHLGRKARFGKVTILGDTPQETSELQAKLRSIMARLKGAAIRPGKTYRFETLQNATQYINSDLISDGHLDASVSLASAIYDPATNRAGITFQLKPGPVIKVDVTGAHLWPWTRKREIPLFQQAGANPEVIQEGRHNLVSYFQSKGYFDVKVTSDVRVQDPQHESIVYSITKGPRHKLDGVSISGNQHFDDKALMGHIKVSKAHLFSHGRFSEHLVTQSVNNLKKVYEAEGFSTVSITPQVKSESNGDISVRFVVNEGPQDVVANFRIEGNTVPENQLTDKPLKLAEGAPYSTKLVDEDKNEIIANYLRKGYLNASFRESATHQKGDKHRLDVVYHITEGPRVQIAQVVTLGRYKTEQWLIDRAVELYPEHVLREDEVLAAENRLYSQDSIFDWAEVDPRRQITTQTEEDMLIKVHEAKRNELTYGVGFDVINRGGSIPSGTVVVPGLPPVGLGSNFRTSQQTFWGPRVNFQYIRRNIFGRAETLTVGALGARLDQRGSLTFSDPHFLGSDWTSSATVDGEHNSENPIFTSVLGEAGYQVQRTLDKANTQNLFFRYNLRDTRLTGLLIPDLVPADDRHVRLSTLSSTYTRDTRDNILDAHKGIYESFEFDVNPQALGSTVSFVKLQAQAAYYKKTFKDIVWANSLRIGMEQQFAGSHVPVSEKFFTGGGSTLRGFPLNGAGPQRVITACGDPADPSTCAPITVPVGGQQLLIVNTELRIPTPAIKKGLGFALFYDGGNVFDRLGFHDFAQQYTNNVGIGVRYETPVGPVRIDLGHNLDHIPGVKSTQLFITIGQAF